MKFFHKKALPEDAGYSGRRRPRTGAQPGASRPQAFSYRAYRSMDAGRAERRPLDMQARARTDGTPAPGGRLVATLSAAKNRMFVLFGGIGLVAVLGFLLYLGSDPKVVLDTNSGEAYFVSSRQTYQQAAARSLAGSVFNHSKLTVDTAKLSQDLTRAYPEIRRAEVSVPLFGSQPVITISPYPPGCIVVTPGSAAYLLDTTGRALVPASQIADNGELSVPTIQDKNAIDVQLGSQVLPASVVLFARQVVAVLDAAKVGYSSLMLPAGTSELDVAIAGKPYYVKFNLQDDTARLQAGTFLATKQRLEQDNITPGEYIDVRVPERAYYK